jgi:hypothetical protein
MTSFDCAYAESWITVEYADELDRGGGLTGEG